VELAQLVRTISASNGTYFEKHPRTIFEMHMGGSLHTLRAGLERIRASAACRACGCDAFAFVSAREPLEYLLSSLHDGFRHVGFFRRRFVGLVRPESEYIDESWHCRVGEIAPQLADAQTKVFLHYVQPKYRFTFDERPPQHVADEAIAALAAMDVVGVTHETNRLYAQLIRRLGLQKRTFTIIGTNARPIGRLHCEHPDWREEETRAFNRTALASDLDQRLYATARRVAAARARAYPGGERQLACEAEGLRKLNPKTPIGTWVRSPQGDGHCKLVGGPPNRQRWRRKGNAQLETGPAPSPSYASAAAASAGRRRLRGAGGGAEAGRGLVRHGGGGGAEVKGVGPLPRS
jgi:hypothetical protein